ncbi:MAG: peptidylprolyl isomerase [Bacteroidales bacterium]|nr:peptidylprolyl isomerase [Bacteroidales bacterium]
MKYKCFSVFLLSVLVGLDVLAQDPVLMQVADKKITKSEFEYIWNKNNSSNVLDKKSLEEYVDLFANFKRKVAEAESLGMDTTASFINELKGYRDQLAAPYLMDKSVEEALYKQTYNRIQTYVEASHILLRVADKASPEDTLVVFNKIQEIYRQLSEDGADFSEMARRFSEDGTRTQGGYLGYSTGFKYVSSFEDALYGCPVGQFTKPFRSAFGYHIAKVHDRKPAFGRYRSGHIMKLFPANADAEMKQAVKDSIFAIYAALKAGGDFTHFAVNRSDDRAAAEQGGVYGLMYCGSLPYAYERAVNELEIGAYSEPFQTNFGWHIVQALEKQPYPSMEELRSDIAGIINRDERALEPKRQFVEKLKYLYQFREVAGSLDDFIAAGERIRVHADSSLFRSLLISGKPLFQLAEHVKSQRDFAQYLNAQSNAFTHVLKQYDAFVQESVLKYEDLRLEYKYPEFRHLIQEYRDGILLFEISNQEVWDKASQDVEGLKKFFKKQKKDYAWSAPKYKGFVVRCANEEVKKAAEKLVRKLEADSVATVLARQFNTDSTRMVQIERGLYAAGEHSAVDALAFETVDLPENSDFPFVFLHGKMLKKGPESYEDVRGLVISDYQNELERRWLDTLKKKYPVQVNMEVLATVNNH